MLNIHFLEKGVKLVSPPHLMYEIPRKLFLMLMNQILFFWLPLLLEIVENLRIKIIYFPVYDVINFKTNFSFSDLFGRKGRTKS